MVNLFVDVSKYGLILLIAVYTYLNFRYFSVDEEKKERLCGRMAWLMFLIHVTAYAVLYLKTDDISVIVFYIVQTVFFAIYMQLSRMIYRNASGILLNNVCMLLMVGMIMLTRLDFEKAVRQFAIIVFAAVVTMIIPFIIGKVWQLAKIPWVYGLAGLALLFLVFMVGNTSFGAQLSLTIAGISIQPSEFVKISYVFFIAAMFSRSTCKRQILVTTLMAGAHILILTLSKDLGSALIFFVTYLFMLLVATSNWLYFGAGLAIGSGAAVFASRVFTHVQNRISAWLNPWADIDNTGYQITQSLFAIGTGSWFGMGLYQGMPNKIPVVEKDFMFAAISEEMGALFALCVLLVCLGCFIQFMMIACSLHETFYKLIAFGLGVTYITQVFLTVGGVIKFIPSTGLTLPLVSYGGSSMFATLIMFGVIQGLYIIKGDEEYTQDTGDEDGYEPDDGYYEEDYGEEY